MNLTIKPSDPTSSEETEALIASCLECGGRLLPDPMVGLLRVFCGCGNPESAWEWVLGYLNNCKLHIWPEIDGGAEWVATYLMASLELTEHGGSVQCSWLTESGEVVLAFLREHGEDWADKGEWIDSNGVMWGNFGQ